MVPGASPWSDSWHEYGLLPQHFTVPSSQSTQEWTEAADTCTGIHVSPKSTAGKSSPIWPLAEPLLVVSP
eukprot:1836483-Amphidinium_carterae.1